jgi:hypothetical protein
MWIKKGGHFKYKLQNAEIWSPAARPPHRLCYRSVGFFCHLRKFALSFPPGSNFTQLQFISLHYTCRHLTSSHLKLHPTAIHSTSKHFRNFGNYTCRNFISSHVNLHPTTLHFTSLHLSTLHFFPFKLHLTTLLLTVIPTIRLVVVA